MLRVLTSKFIVESFKLTELANCTGIMHNSRKRFKYDGKKKKKSDYIEEVSAPNELQKQQEEETRIREIDVGIVEFVGSHRGFSGVLKHR